MFIYQLHIVLQSLGNTHNIHINITVQNKNILPNDENPDLQRESSKSYAAFTLTLQLKSPKLL